jgi:hypothetical protein
MMTAVVKYVAKTVELSLAHHHLPLPAQLGIGFSIVANDLGTTVPQDLPTHQSPLTAFRGAEFNSFVLPPPMLILALPTAEMVSSSSDCRIMPLALAAPFLLSCESEAKACGPLIRCLVVGAF